MVGLRFDSATTQLASAMIDDAEAEIDKYLSKRYDLSSNTFQTSTSIPPLVTSLCLKLSEAYLWRTTSRGGKESLTRSEKLEKTVLDNLKQIAEYKLDLISSSGSVIADMQNTAYRVLCNTSDYTTTFNEDSELNWSVDSDKLEDIADSERN